MWLSPRYRGHGLGARLLATLEAVACGTPVVATNAAEAAACDIVTTVTNAPEPVLHGRWLSDGCHLNLVGAHDPTHREADSEAVARAAIYVDSMDGALNEAGDILIPLSEGRISEGAIVGEIGSLLAGGAPGRLDAEQVTLYKSLGHAAQDLYAAEAVYRRAVDRGLGVVADFASPAG